MRILSLLHFAGCVVKGRNAMLLANVKADAAAASMPDTNPEPAPGTVPGAGRTGGSLGCATVEDMSGEERVSSAGAVGGGRGKDVP